MDTSAKHVSSGEKSTKGTEQNQPIQIIERRLHNDRRGDGRSGSQPPWHDDEIGLYDLWVVFKKQRYVILGAVIIFTVATIVAVLMTPKVYRYSAAIEFGQIPSPNPNAKSELIDSMETVVGKLNEQYIPQVQYAYLSESGETGAPPAITIRQPKNSHLIILEGMAPLSKAAIYDALINDTAALLIAEHKEKISSVRRHYQSDLALAKLKLDELSDKDLLSFKQEVIKRQAEDAERGLGQLKDQLGLNQAQIRGLGRQEELLDSEIKEISALVKRSLANRATAAAGASDANTAMTLLLLDNDSRQNQEHLADLEKQRYVLLPRQREELAVQAGDIVREQKSQQAVIDEIKMEGEKLVIDWRREQSRQVEAINQIQAQLAEVRDTTQLSSPVVSSSPVGTPRRAKVMIGLFAGLAVGIFLAFMRESFAKSRRHAAGMLEN